MRLFASILRFTATLAVAFFLLTALLWTAPGREMEDSLWGQSSVSGVSAAPRWRDYPSFALWYSGELAHRRAGNSLQFGIPVTALIEERAPVTASHAWRGLLAAWFASLLAGVAAHRWPALGRIALGTGSLLLSLPAAFVVLTLALNGVAPWLGVAISVWPKVYSYWQTLLDSARRRPHVLSLLAQGAGPWRVQWFGIWWPQLRQILGLAAISVPLLLGALIPVEVLCDEPGLGQLAWHAVAGRDLPLLTTLTLLFTAVTCAMSLLAEALRPETA